MKEKSRFSLHETAVFYLFTMGGSLFTFGKCGIYCYLAAFAAGIVTYLVFYKLKRLKNKVFLFAVSVLGILSGLYTFGNFIYFIKNKQLFYMPYLAIGLVFAAVVIYFFISDIKTIKKFSLAAFLVCNLFFLLLFLTTVKNADFTDIKYALNFDAKESLRVYFSLFFPVIIPLIELKNPSFKSGIYGISSAAVTLLIFVVLTYCTFGKINTRLNSPILALVDTANVGRVFTRLDIFLHTVIYLSCLIRCVFGLKSSYGICRTFNKKGLKC